MTATLTKPLTDGQRTFIGLLQSKLGPVVTRKQIIEVAKENNVEFPWWLLRQPFKSFRTGRGHYNLDSILAAADALVSGNTVANSTPATTTTSPETPGVPA